MLASNPSQHLELQPVSRRNPLRFNQSVKRSSDVIDKECCYAGVRLWPIATCGPETIVGRFRGIGDMAEHATCSTRLRMTHRRFTGGDGKTGSILKRRSPYRSTAKMRHLPGTPLRD